MARLGDRAALIPAGGAQPRNFPANHLPFRASSHFLYLVGRGLSGAMLLMEGGSAVLYRPTPPPGDDLWHGPSHAADALGESIGCPVRPLETLKVPRGTLTLPSMDAVTRAHQESLLGRSVGGAVSAADEPLAQAMVETRLIHDDAAIAALRRVGRVTIEGHRAGLAALAPGKRAYEVWAAMQQVFTAHGMGHAYAPIVTPHGEVLHAHDLDAVLKEGDLLLADVGAETADGWAGDVTRTWAVNGRYSPTQAAIVEVVQRAHDAAIAACTPGRRYRDVHLLASRVIAAGLVDLGILRGDPDELVADDVHAVFFPHGIGHLIGLDVHDMEDLGDRPGYPAGRTRSDRFGLGFLRLDRTLQPGMAVTIEPGFYQVPAILADPSRVTPHGDRINRTRLAAFADVRGVRIEDDVLITAQGPEVLTPGLPNC